MKYLGDYAEDATLDFKFSTVDTDNAPITLADTPAISIYKANSDTPTTTGVTLTVDFDSITGCHHVRVALTDAFYATGNDYQAVITAGEVDGISVIGACVAEFSIENRFAEVDVVKWLGTTAQGADGRPQVDVELIEGADPTDTIRDAIVDDATRIDASALNTATGTTIPAILDDTDLIDDATSGLAKIATDVAAVLVDTGTTLDALIKDVPTNAELATALGTADDPVLAAIAALENLSAADVNAQVLDVLNTDTFALPGQGAPTATPTLAEALLYLFKAWRNRSTQTSSEYALYADDGTTKDQEAACSDDATTFVRGEVGTGA